MQINFMEEKSKGNPQQRKVVIPYARRVRPPSPASSRCLPAGYYGHALRHFHCPHG